MPWMALGASSQGASMGSCWSGISAPGPPSMPATPMAVLSGAWPLSLPQLPQQVHPALHTQVTAGVQQPCMSVLSRNPGAVQGWSLARHEALARLILFSSCILPLMLRQQQERNTIACQFSYEGMKGVQS